MLSSNSLTDMWHNQSENNLSTCVCQYLNIQDGNLRNKCINALLFGGDDFEPSQFPLCSIKDKQSSKLENI